ncbi:hypothetical protein H4R21_004882, partial [Coemansia helicoidea]
MFARPFTKIHVTITRGGNTLVAFWLPADAATFGDLVVAARQSGIQVFTLIGNGTFATYSYPLANLVGEDVAGTTRDNLP